MVFEHRNGVCAICEGRIIRYPHPQPDHADVWAHQSQDDWISNPHDPQPRAAGDCKDCGEPVYQHPTLPERFAHIGPRPADSHTAVPK